MNSASSQRFWSIFSGNNNCLNVTNNAGWGLVGGQNWLVIWVKQGQGLICKQFDALSPKKYHQRWCNILQGFDDTPGARCRHLAPGTWHHNFQVPGDMKGGQVGYPWKGPLELQYSSLVHSIESFGPSLIQATSPNVSCLLNWVVPRQGPHLWVGEPD